MKKILLAGTALVGVAILSSPAQAELKLDLGGYFRGYAVHADSDETGGATDSLREFDFRRDAEIHFTGETTLDNGLTVGFHAENVLGDEISLNESNEVYAYFSGGWGRINFGSEDGAAYLLQVGAPSADSNVDGMRSYIQAINDEAGGFFTVAPFTAAPFAAAGLGGTIFGDATLDYDHADFRATDRITYLTPKFNGFQAGVSYAPENVQNSIVNNIAAPEQDDDVNDWEDLWEAAVRWDGEFNGFGLSLGAGYSTADLEADSAALNGLTDSLDTWNVGGSVSFNSFTVGGAYLSSTTSEVTAVGPPVVSTDIDKDTWVVGGGWDNGPYHVGVSYLNSELEEGAANLEADRWTVGGGYTFGPGMTFRGAVAFGEFDTGVSATSNDFTQVTVGTDIQF